ncbi:MAG: YaeQ family protein [Desulfuromonadales bacterium]|nr:MAG: YaeQ family protein [Desulfuromonadales bacterium]
MAQPSTIYRAGIQLSDIDRNLYETLQITVARHPSETAERLVARLLAYALFHEDDLEFTKGICAGDEPDLWVKGPDGRVTLWIEVGLPDPERLVKASRHAGRVILLACGSSRWRWEEQHLAKLAGISNLTVLGLDQGFLEQVVARLQRSIVWSLTITEGSLYLDVGGETLETLPVHLA